MSLLSLVVAIEITYICTKLRTDFIKCLYSSETVTGALELAWAEEAIGEAVGD